MRVMYDSTNPFDIPTGAQMVAGYVDGGYAWSAAGWARFPHAVKVGISIYSSRNNGIVLDVEPGCTWPPANAVAWVQRRRASGVDPTVYCNQQNDLPAVRAAFQAAGVAEPHYWTSGYPGIGKALYPGTISHQYANPLTSGGHFDLSVVADNWPGVDSAPTGPGGIVSGGVVIPGAPSFPTTPITEDDMTLTTFNVTDGTREYAVVGRYGDVVGAFASEEELGGVTRVCSAVPGTVNSRELALYGAWRARSTSIASVADQVAKIGADAAALVLNATKGA